MKAGPAKVETMFHDVLIDFALPMVSALQDVVLFRVLLALIALQGVTFLYALAVLSLTTHKVHKRYGLKFETYGGFTEIDEQFARNTHFDSRQRFKKNPVFIDCGANIGDWLVLAKQLYPASEIHAFEPVTELSRICSANVKHNDLSGVTVVNAAVGESDDFADITLRRFDSGAASLVWDAKGMTSTVSLASIYAYIFGLNAYYFGFKVYALWQRIVLGLFFVATLPATYLTLQVQPRISQRVRVLKLANYIHEYIPDRDIDLLKLDVEGFAYEALLGLDQACWDKIKNVAIEVEGGINKDKIKEALKKNGFDYVEIMEGSVLQIHGYRG